MEQPPNIYAYQALNAATREIRVLKLHPGREADKISGELLTTVFDSRSPYDALSYQWGNPTVTKPIYLGPNEELQITSFLREALTFIRKHDEVIIIWIDAICISQKDVSERNHQVSMMKEIYSNARTVRVWLNQEIDSSSPCFAILAKLDKCS
ncbi:HET-domain-containing protein, partial [Lophium mytilinum]